MNKDALKTASRIARHRAERYAQFLEDCKIDGRVLRYCIPPEIIDARVTHARIMYNLAMSIYPNQDRELRKLAVKFLCQQVEDIANYGGSISWGYSIPSAPATK